MRSVFLLCITAAPTLWSVTAAGAGRVNHQHVLDLSIGARLIATSETEAQWLDEDAILTLARKNVHFIDVTDGDISWGHSVLGGTGSFAAVPTFPPAAVQQSTVGRLITAINTERMKEFLTTLTEFHTRQYSTITGKAASQWIYDNAVNDAKDAKDAMAAGNFKVTVSKFSHPWAQFSVIARIEPASFALAADQRVVIISAHLDSVNHADPYSGRAPGADDDGSGTATIFEAYRLLLVGSFELVHPIEFHWYSAEEGGKLGSQKVVAQYVANAVPVRAQLQMDMTGYTPPNKQAIIGIASDNVDHALTKFLRVVAAEYCSLPWGSISCGFACSDHWSWHKAGYPASFAFESAFEDSNPYVHTPNDDISRISYSHMKEYVKLALAVALELGMEK
ncbi:hypothetical protein HDU88_007289 [Geranomyces variabilis]|nr:hypothetical protein HDU88_007289 [Geranomyces variabilis]